MTIPAERTLAVKYAREFMRDLLDPKITPKVPKEVRQMASRVLRHFPDSQDIYEAAEAVPSIFSVPQFEEEVHYENYDCFRATRAELYGVRIAHKQRSSKSSR